MRKIFCIIPFIFLCSFLRGNPDTTNFTQLIEREKNPLKRVDLLNDLAYKTIRDNPGQSILLAHKALELAQKNTYEKGIGLAYSNLSISHIIQGRRDSAILLQSKSHQIGLANDDQEVLAESYHADGIIHQLQGHYSEALISYYNALSINRKLNRSIKALDQLNNISIVHREFRDYESALAYIEEHNALCAQIGDTSTLSKGKVNKGYIYLDMEKYQVAKDFILPELESFQQSKNAYRIVVVYNILGQIYTGLHVLDSARIYASKAIELAQSLSYNFGIVHGMSTQCRILYEEGKFAEAIEIAEKALEINGPDQKNRHTEQVTEIAAKSYKNVGNAEKALFFQEQLIEIKTRIYNLEKVRFVNRMELEKKLQDQALLQIERENDSEIRRKNILLIFLLSIFFLVILFSFLLFRNLRRISSLNSRLKERNAEINKHNEELKELTYITTHDLKEPANTIFSFTNLLQNKFEKELPSGSVPLFEMISKTSEGMLNSIGKLHGYFLLGNRSELEWVDVNQIIDAVEVQLADKFSDPSIHMIRGRMPRLRAYSHELEKLFLNLISNAIKYRKPNEICHIEIRYRELESHYQFSVSDNGIGMDSEDIGKIFGLFQRLHTQGEIEGDGIGLSEVKKIVKIHKGEIHATSEVGKGSIFTFTIKKELNQPALHEYNGN
ncbi:MAG: ATP-binding protein [Bacteroidota bacterium]